MLRSLPGLAVPQDLPLEPALVVHHLPEVLVEIQHVLTAVLPQGLEALVEGDDPR
jgi:hypothetical protein